MKKILVKDFIREIDAKLICGNENQELKDFKKDTRELQVGDTYVGIKGENIDGSILYEKAFESGASACIINDIQLEDKSIKKYQDRVIIKVDDTVSALQKIAKYKRQLYEIPVIGVTGSVGKTSTKDLIASVMAKKFKKIGRAHV